MNIEHVALSTIKRWHRNPKRHADADIKASIKRFGFTVPLMVDTNTDALVAGHGRLDALLALKKEGADRPANINHDIQHDDWLVPVISHAFKDKAEAEAYVVADNRLTQLGGWDDGALKAILGDLSGIEGGLEGIGYTPESIEAMLHESELAELKMAPVGLAQDQKPKNAREDRCWVWSDTPDKESMDRLIAVFGKKGDRELDPAKLLVAAGLYAQHMSM